MLRIKRIARVKGFMPTTWAVFDGEYLLRLFTTKYAAYEFKDYMENNKEGK